jgi:hypothetical protein
LPEQDDRTRFHGRPPSLCSWAADRSAWPRGLATENEPIHASRDGRLHIPARAPRPARYQAARFAAWERFAQDSYHYRLTPASLEAAQRQGLRVGHLTVLLRHHAQAVPPGLLQALEHWEASGSASRLERR